MSSCRATNETVTYEVRESDGYVYGVNSCDVTEVL